MSCRCCSSSAAPRFSESDGLRRRCAFSSSATASPPRTIFPAVVATLARWFGGRDRVPEDRPGWDEPGGSLERRTGAGGAGFRRLGRGRHAAGPVGAAGEPGRTCASGRSGLPPWRESTGPARAPDRLARELSLRCDAGRDHGRTRTRRRRRAPSCIRPASPGRRRGGGARALPLYGPDGFHPSPLGTYLAALVVLRGPHRPSRRSASRVRIDRPGFQLDVSRSAGDRLLRNAAVAEALWVGK